MTETVMVVLEARRGRLAGASLHAAARARDVSTSLGARLVVALVAPDADRLLKGLDLDADERVAVNVAPGSDGPDNQIAAVLRLAGETGASVLIFAHTADAMGVAPAVAATLRAGLATDVIEVAEVNGRVTAARSSFDGKLVEHVGFTHDRVVLTMRAGSAPQDEGNGVDRPVRTIDADPVTERVTHLDWSDPDDDGIDISKSELLLSVGRPIGSVDNAARVGRLAAALGGTLGASRPVVDSGWTEKTRQVGQTGRTVKPKVYVALGISGAIQHLSGMSGSETVIAVNTDPSAPIHAVADYVAHVDLMAVVQAMEEQVDVSAAPV